MVLDKTYSAIINIETNIDKSLRLGYLESIRDKIKDEVGFRQIIPNDDDIIIGVDISCHELVICITFWNDELNVDTIPTIEKAVTKYLDEVNDAKIKFAFVEDDKDIKISENGKLYGAFYDLDTLMPIAPPKVTIETLEIKSIKSNIKEEIKRFWRTK